MLRKMPYSPEEGSLPVDQRAIMTHLQH